jgi:hypothetical protein
MENSKTVPQENQSLSEQEISSPIPSCDPIPQVDQGDAFSKELPDQRERGRNIPADCKTYSGARRSHRDRLGYVYFLTDGEVVKIGFSLNVAARLTNLRRDTGRALDLIDSFVGWMPDESALHRRFHRSRIRGGGLRDWFRPTPSIFQFIDRLREFREEISLHLITLGEIIAGKARTATMPTPTTRAFSEWLEKHKGELPPDLLRQAEMVGLHLKGIDMNGNNPGAHALLTKFAAPVVADFADAWAGHRGLKIA